MKLNRIFIAIVCAASIFVSCSKDDSDEQKYSESDKFVGTYQNQVGDYLIITKTGENSIKLNYKNELNSNSDWDHMFNATVSGNTLDVPNQIWEKENLTVSAHGVLINDVLFMDYYYDNGTSELGFEYQKLNL